MIDPHLPHISEIVDYSGNLLQKQPNTKYKEIFKKIFHHISPRQIQKFYFYFVLLKILLPKQLNTC